MIRVAVVADTPAAREFLERRVGGILKNVGVVNQVLESDLVSERLDLVVVHHLGGRIKELRARMKKVPVFAVELSLLPIGVKTLMMMVRSDETIAVVAQHQRCANNLLREVIEAGIVRCRFVSGTFQDIDGIRADRFVTSEEMLDGIPYTIRNDPRMIVVPRMISPESSAKLISIAIEIATSKRERRLTASR
ncbi:MAG: hypothetical protein K6T83_16495 [Alicyclobacillus sp.]|nr:hypothetical protein [Alicyclobacillus sp.]